MDSVALPITHFALCKFWKTVIGELQLEVELCME